jgi:hypothetical protein
MMAKIAGLAGLMAGMSHFASKGKKKKKAISKEEKEMKKKIAMKKLEKFKDKKGGSYVQTGNGTSAAHGKYKGK